MSKLYIYIEVPESLEIPYEPILGSDYVEGQLTRRNLLVLINLQVNDNNVEYQSLTTLDGGTESSKIHYGLNQSYQQPFQMVKRLKYSGKQVFPWLYYQCLEALAAEQKTTNELIKIHDFAATERGTPTIREGVIISLAFQPQYAGKSFCSIEFTFEEIESRSV